jgi:hypothetical protein
VSVFLLCVWLNNKVLGLVQSSDYGLVHKPIIAVCCSCYDCQGLMKIKVQSRHPLQPCMYAMFLLCNSVIEHQDLFKTQKSNYRNVLSVSKCL